MVTNVWIPESITWPVVLFERDLYPLVVPTAEELSTAFDEGWWDEVESLFDAHGARYDVIVQDSAVELLPRGLDVNGFAERLRSALKRYMNQGRLRVRPATESQVEQIESLTLEELLAWVLQHIR